MKPIYKDIQLCAHLQNLWSGFYNHYQMQFTETALKRTYDTIGLSTDFMFDVIIDIKYKDE